MNQAANILTQNLAQGFVDLSRAPLAAAAFAELGVCDIR